jgi:hypothetical protein
MLRTADGDLRYYVANDNVVSPRYTALSPASLAEAYAPPRTLLLLFFPPLLLLLLLLRKVPSHRPHADLLLFGLSSDRVGADALHFCTKRRTGVMFHFLSPAQEMGKVLLYYHSCDDW